MNRTRPTLPRPCGSVNGPPVYAGSLAPRRRGRRPAAELAAIRGRVELLMLQGLRGPAIHRALSGPESPNPLAISERQVRAHMAAVERSWVERADRETTETERAKAVAMVEETMRVALQRSTMHAGSNMGVGYLNVHVKLLERWAKLRGLDAPQRQELTGRDGSPLQLQPVAMADHPAEHLTPKERADGFRRLAEAADAEADEAGDES
jgi:hypothetical protein